MPKTAKSDPNAANEEPKADYLSSRSLQASDIYNLGTGDNRRRATLIQHLQSLSHDSNAHEVIQLLYDIRTHQDHHKMQKVFEKNPDHTIAHKAKNHGEDIIGLLVDDYLEQINIPQDEDELAALENHLADVIMTSLKEFQEVVEEIREDVQTVTERFENEPSINHVTDLVEQIRANMHQDVIKGIVKKLHPSHLSHPIFQRHSQHLSPSAALATAWVQHAHRAGKDVHDHDAAVAFVREELHAHLQEHFAHVIDDSGQVAPETQPIPAALPLASIIEAREMDPELDRAFVFLEAIRARHIFYTETGSSPPLAGIQQNDFTRYVTAVTESDENVPIEQAALNHVNGLLKGSDIRGYFRQNVDSLGTLFVRAVINNDTFKKESYLQLEEARLRLMAEETEAKREILKAVPKGTVLRSILENEEQDTFVCLLNIWKNGGDNDISALERIIDEATREANEYLDIDYEEIHQKERDSITDELRAPIMAYAREFVEKNAHIAGALQMTSRVRKLLNGTGTPTQQEISDMENLITALEKESDHLIWLIYEAEGDEPLLDMINYWMNEHPLLATKDQKAWEPSLKSFLIRTAAQINKHVPLSPESMPPELSESFRSTLHSLEASRHKLENETELKRDLTESLENAPDGSLTQRVCRLLNVAAQEFTTYRPLMEATLRSRKLYDILGCYLDTKFEPQSLATLYIAHVKSTGDKAGTFEEYLLHLDRLFRESCRAGLYADLLSWGEISDSSPAPQTLEHMYRKRRSAPRAPENTDHEEMPTARPGEISEIRQVMTRPLSVPAKPTETINVFDAGELRTVTSGQYVDITFARKGSNFTVEDGAKLSVFMIDDETTIRLNGPNACLKIEKTAQFCNRFRILDKNGNPISDHPNIVLGHGVMEKLAS
ncbi:hypothetical protein JXD20_01345 [Candidatus Peregrinibacteria bacterium]|nr:hypothetical protein [Candidatus Peregrinibacteria bacterium]